MVLVHLHVCHCFFAQLFLQSLVDLLLLNFNIACPFLVIARRVCVHKVTELYRFHNLLLCDYKHIAVHKQFDVLGRAEWQ